MEATMTTQEYLDSLRDKTSLQTRDEGRTFVSEMMEITEEPWFLDRILNVENAFDLGPDKEMEARRKYLGASVLLARGNKLLERMIDGERLPDIYEKMNNRISMHCVSDYIRGPRISDGTRDKYRDLDQLVGGDSRYLESMPYRSTGNILSYTWLVGSALWFAEAADVSINLDFLNPDKSFGYAAALVVAGAAGVGITANALIYNSVRRPVEEHERYDRLVTKFQNLFDKYIDQPLKRNNTQKNLY